LGWRLSSPRPLASLAHPPAQIRHHVDHRRSSTDGNVTNDSYGTDHDIYRLGEHSSVRLPRIGWAAGQAAKEVRWLPELAPHLPLALSVPLAMGRPGEGYPFDWSVYQWLPGADANGTIADLEQAAVDLAGFVRALQKIDVTGAHPRPPGGRGGPLAQHDEQVRRSVAQLGDRAGGTAILRSWQE
jgi:aminoglycoside phosphotransferase (APT) family kinase protein